MKTLSKIAIGTVAGIGLAFAAAAFAHGPGFGYGAGGHGYGVGMMGPHGGGPGYGMHGPYGGRPGAGPCLAAGTVETRLDSLKSELKLTDTQTKAWEAFENAVRNQVQVRTEARPHWSQNQDEHIALMEQRLAGMKALQKARNDLYAVLTPEQKSVADRYGFRGPRG